MDVQECIEPRCHLIIKNFLDTDEYSNVWNEILNAEEKMEVGIFTGGRNHKFHWIAKQGQGKKGFITNSPIATAFLLKIANEHFVKKYAEKFRCAVFENFRYQTSWSCKISCYSEGEFYGLHNDDWLMGSLSCILMICDKPKPFKGGEFVLSHNGVEKTIPFKNNTLIIFPSSTMHKSLPIKSNSKKYKDERFTLQFFSESRVYD